MIEEIVIRDLGVIREAKLELGKGLTVLTGETGAGKTMVLNALGLLLGDRADSSAIRKGASQLYVEGRWLVSKDTESSLSQQNIEVYDGELIVNRSVSAEGRSKASLSGRAVPVAMLSEIGEQLVVVHGQAEQVRLRSAGAQREALDLFAGSALAGKLIDYREVFELWKKTQQRLENLSSESESRARQAAELREAIVELDRLAPAIGEDSELAELAERLSHTESLRQAALQAHFELTGEGVAEAGSAIDAAGRARKALELAAEHDPKLAELAHELRELGFALNEAAANLSSYLAGLEENSATELERVQLRRAALASAIKKYGGDLTSVVEYWQSAEQRLTDLDSSDEAIQELRAQQAELAGRASELAKELTKLRVLAAKELEAKVTEELAALAMAGASLRVEVSAAAELGVYGADQVAILLSAYSGADPRPIGKGASGGELSRIMLAIEVVLARKELAPTFVFDEVDAGVGGAAATEVGRRLAQLARSAQVIVVTHLPQVAAFATNHLRVKKNSDGEFTASSVERLSGEAVVEELARMLSGLSESDSGRSHAQELIDRAKKDLSEAR